jgi:CPA2 family monovalent cation:H+ antiporter-2
MRRQVFGLGAMELIWCGSLLIALGACGIAGPALDAAALALGLALAMSSTALVLRITDTGTPVGRAALSMLLFEDIALVPIIFLLGAMGAHARPARALAAAVPHAGARRASILALLVFGRFLLPRLFAQAARTKSPELFLAASLLVVISPSLATSAVGLSPIVGALLAGLLIAETEYHGEVEAYHRAVQGAGAGRIPDHHRHEHRSARGMGQASARSCSHGRASCWPRRWSPGCCCA